MTKYNSFAELNAYYAKRYGDDWDKRGRGCLDEAGQQAWIDACYDLYPKEYKLRNTFKAEDGESWQHDGKRFNIPVWIIKNSWGTSWGKSGYIWLQRGVNKCGILEMISTIIV